MKVLLLGKFYPIKGGVEKVMWDITRGVSARGVDCDMLCACLPGEFPAEAADARSVTGCRGARVLDFNEHGHLYCVRAYRKVAATMMSPDMIRALRRICSDYDIIHVHHPDPMAALALMLSGYRGRVILHWHSDILSQKVLLTMIRPLQSWLIRRADKIVGTTPVYVQQSPELRHVQDKIGYIPIGVPPVPEAEEKAREIRSRFQGKKIIYSLGRLVPYKGFRHLIEAARWLDDSYQVVIGGGGPLRDELQAQIDEAGLSSRVTLLGFVPDDEFAAWYHACDLFCLSSIWKTEAFAIVQIEAMSCGKPVVATNIPESGVSWVNCHNVSGLNVTPGDGRAIAEAIMTITDNQETYDGFSARAKTRYEKLFRYETMIDKCIALYENQQ